MGKLADIKNEDQQKAFELYSDGTDSYLSVKCSDNKRGHRFVAIKLKDALHQISQAVGADERRSICDQLTKNK